MYALVLVCREAESQRFVDTDDKAELVAYDHVRGRLTSSMLPSLLLVLSPCLGFFDRTAIWLRRAFGMGEAFSSSDFGGSLATLLLFLTSAISDCAFCTSGFVRADSVRGPRGRFGLGCWLRLESPDGLRCRLRLRVFEAGAPC